VNLFDLVHLVGSCGRVQKKVVGSGLSGCINGLCPLLAQQGFCLGVGNLKYYNSVVRDEITVLI